MFKRMWARIAAWRAGRLEQWKLYYQLNRDDLPEDDPRRAAFDAGYRRTVAKQDRLKAVAGIK